MDLRADDRPSQVGRRPHLRRPHAPPGGRQDRQGARQAQRRSKEVEDDFENVGDLWFFKRDGQKGRVEGYRIDNIIKDIKQARHDETANVENVRIDTPEITVTLFGKAKEEPKEWKFYVGKENAGLVYVASSDNQGKVFAVPKRSLESLFFANPNDLRYKRPFDFTDANATAVILKKGAADVELKRGENNLWSFVTPKLGIVGYESEAPPPPKNPHEPKKEMPTPTGGVKLLLSNILKIHVENDNDFEPLGSPVGKYGLEAGKESMKIEVVSGEKEKAEKAEKGKKEANTETMLIGLQNKDRKDGTYYFARMADDDGVFQINAQYLEPVEKVLKDPGKIRSLDVAIFDQAKIDAITLAVGKEEFQFFKTEKEKDEIRLQFKMPAEVSWEMIVGKEKKKANDSAHSYFAGAGRGEEGDRRIPRFGPRRRMKRRRTPNGASTARPQSSLSIRRHRERKEGRSQGRERQERRKRKEGHRQEGREKGFSADAEKKRQAGGEA